MPAELCALDSLMLEWAILEGAPGAFGLLVALSPGQISLLPTVLWYLVSLPNKTLPVW